MSMLTAQANHLREVAHTVERVKNDSVGKLSLSGSIALAMAAMDMRDAADTIDELRNRLTETCHIAVHDNLSETDGRGDVWLECGACHWQMPLEPGTPKFAYCPNCGRKVVE